MPIMKTETLSMRRYWATRGHLNLALSVIHETFCVTACSFR